MRRFIFSSMRRPAFFLLVLILMSGQTPIVWRGGQKPGNASINASSSQMVYRYQRSYYGLGTWDDSVATYSAGTWQRLTGQPLVYLGTLTRSVDANSIVDFFFDNTGGTGVKFISKTQPDAASVAVYVDGIFQRTVQQWATCSTFIDQNVIDIGAFAPGKHQLRLVVGPPNNTCTLPTWATVDGFIVY